MYKNILCAVFLLIVFNVKSQLLFTINVPPQGIIQKPQLWNFLVTNSNSDQQQIKIKLTMRDISASEIILTGETGDVYVNSGVTPLFANNVAPIQYEYFSPKITDFEPNGFLPVGQYEVCYTFFKNDHLNYQEVATECINVFIEPISPPMLTMPFDGSETEIKTPQFSWLPPSPLNMFNILTYDFTLVEVTEGQTSAEAIQQNMPVYIAHNLPDIFLNYSGTYTALDTGKLYAWQIIANNNDEYAGQSEVWTFKIKGDSIIRIQKNLEPFIKLKEQMDATIGVFGVAIRFFYINEAEDTNITYTISSLENDDIGTVVKSGTVKLMSGENYLEIPLQGGEILSNNKFYLLKVLNSRNETWMAKFIYHQPE